MFVVPILLRLHTPSSKNAVSVAYYANIRVCGLVCGGNGGQVHPARRIRVARHKARGPPPPEVSEPNGTQEPFWFPLRQMNMEKTCNPQALTHDLACPETKSDAPMTRYYAIQQNTICVR